GPVSALPDGRRGPGDRLRRPREPRPGPPQTGAGSARARSAPPLCLIGQMPDPAPPAPMPEPDRGRDRFRVRGLGGRPPLRRLRPGRSVVDALPTAALGLGLPVLGAVDDVRTGDVA